MIPETKLNAVKKALQEAFDVSEFEDIRELTGNFVIRNDNDEAEYLRSYFGEEVNEYRHARFFLMS